jgi:serine/threonine-protein kinase
MGNEGPRRQSGEVLGGRYRVIGLLGGGGMGFVYLAEDLRVPGRKRAVKELKHSADISRFHEEVRLLGSVSHPNLPQIVDAIEPDGASGGYIVMDYIQGETLAALFARLGRRLPQRTVVSIARQVCGIFRYLHEELETPIVYRDLKPSNLMIDAQGRIRLIDFGIARFLRPDRPEDTVRLGTPGFAAPEQYAGKSGVRSDLYNLGALLYYLLSGGKEPGQGPKLEQAGVTPELARIVAKLLAVDPQQRYASAGEVLAALERLGEEPAERRVRARVPVIAVGALYEGAGATFLCEALEAAVRRAAVRSRRTVRVAVRRRAGAGGEAAVEFGTVERGTADPPGDRSADPVFGFADPPADLPLDPPADLVICDIGSRWHDLPEHALPPAWADLIVLAADPIPDGWRRTVTERKLRLAEAWRREGTAVCWVANRDVPVKGREAWLASFPWRPLCAVPALAFAWTVEAAWRGERLPDHRRAAPLIDQALRPLLQKIFEILEKPLEKSGLDPYNRN